METHCVRPKVSRHVFPKACVAFWFMALNISVWAQSFISELGVLTDLKETLSSFNILIWKA